MEFEEILWKGGAPDSFRWRQLPIAGCCGHGDETFMFHKKTRHSSLAKRLPASQGLCSIQLHMYVRRPTWSRPQLNQLPRVKYSGLPCVPSARKCKPVTKHWLRSDQELSRQDKQAPKRPCSGRPSPCFAIARHCTQYHCARPPLPFALHFRSERTHKRLA
jgi:hypothetical protein